MGDVAQLGRLEEFPGQGRASLRGGEGRSIMPRALEACRTGLGETLEASLKFHLACPPPRPAPGMKCGISPST